MIFLAFRMSLGAYMALISPSEDQRSMRASMSTGKDIIAKICRFDSFKYSLLNEGNPLNNKDVAIGHYVTAFYNDTP